MENFVWYKMFKIMKFNVFQELIINQTFCKILKIFLIKKIFKYLLMKNYLLLIKMLFLFMVNIGLMQILGRIKIYLVKIKT